jgi:hypothetical protein
VGVHYCRYPRGVVFAKNVKTLFSQGIYKKKFFIICTLVCPFLLGPLSFENDELLLINKNIIFSHKVHNIKMKNMKLQKESCKLW